jgi:hypothetical protein
MPGWRACVNSTQFLARSWPRSRPRRQRAPAERLGPRFLRLHRRIIVRIAAIDRIEPRPHGGYWLHMASGERIGSGKAYARAIRLLSRSSTSPSRSR